MCLLDTTDVEEAMFALLCWSTVSLSYTFHCRQLKFQPVGPGMPYLRNFCGQIITPIERLALTAPL